MRFHRLRERTVIVMLQRIDDRLMFGDGISQMRRFAFELETAVHAPNRLHQRIEHFVFQRAEQRI